MMWGLCYFYRLTYCLNDLYTYGMKNTFEGGNNAPQAGEGKGGSPEKKLASNNYLKSLLTAGTMLLTMTGVLSSKANAQTGKTSAKDSIENVYQNKLDSYNDSLTLYNFYKTQLKYLGKEGEAEPFDENAYNQDELAYNHHLLDLAAKHRTAVEDSLKKEYDAKRINQDQYLAYLDLAKRLTGDERLRSQAVKAVVKDPKHFSRIAGGNLLNTQMMPTEQFTDAEGHKHPDYRNYEPKVKPEEPKKEYIEVKDEQQ